MVWFWTRDNDTLRLETRYDNDAEGYVAILRWPDGREEIERFLDAAIVTCERITLSFRRIVE